MKKKLSLSFLGAISIIAPVATVISCGVGVRREPRIILTELTDFHGQYNPKEPFDKRLESFGKDAFLNQDLSKNPEFDVPSNIKILSGGAFHGTKLPSNFELPKTVTTIMFGAFEGAIGPGDMMVQQLGQSQDSYPPMDPFIMAQESAIRGGHILSKHWLPQPKNADIIASASSVPTNELELSIDFTQNGYLTANELVAKISPLITANQNPFTSVRIISAGTTNTPVVLNLAGISATSTSAQVANAIIAATKTITITGNEWAKNAFVVKSGVSVNANMISSVVRSADLNITLDLTKVGYISVTEVEAKITPLIPANQNPFTSITYINADGTHSPVKLSLPSIYPSSTPSDVANKIVETSQSITNPSDVWAKERYNQFNNLTSSSPCKFSWEVLPSGSQWTWIDRIEHWKGMQ